MAGICKRIRQGYTGMSPRSIYITAHPFEILIGLACVVTAIGFFLVDGAVERSAIGQAVHPYDYLWTGGYLVAGVLILCGIVALKPRIEASGLGLLAIAVLMNLTAISLLRGWEALPSISIQLSVFLACLLRLRNLRETDIWKLL